LDITYKSLILLKIIFIIATHSVQLLVSFHKIIYSIFLANYCSRMAENEKENARPWARKESTGAQTAAEAKKNSYWKNVAKSKLKSNKGPSRKNDVFQRPDLNNFGLAQHRTHKQHGNKKSRPREEKKAPFHILLRELHKEEHFKVNFLSVCYHYIFHFQLLIYDEKSLVKFMMAQEFCFKIN
jgi:hypothetical protein